jgi:hypothetical protein
LSASVLAGPVAHFSRTGILFGGAVTNTTSSTQPVFVTNTGDAPLTITSLTITGPEASYFLVAGACGGPPITLGPGQRCRIDLVFKPLGFTAAFGINHATLTVQSSAVPPSTDIALSGDTDKGAFPGDGYGNQATYVPSPEWLDFGTQSVGIASTPQTLALTNKTLYPFDIDQFALVGGDRDDFAMTANCAVGGKFSPATPCTAIVTFTPKAAGRGQPSSPSLRTLLTANGPIAIRSMAMAATPVPPRASPWSSTTTSRSTTISSPTSPPSRRISTQANTPTRWTRTGSTFKAYLTEQAGGSPVCRYYIPPGKGDSHFFGRGTVECTATGAANPTFTLEAHEFMFLSLPVSGVCPPATTAIYRVFSNRPDANHRYMTDRAIRDQMVARGWLGEGDGPDLVVLQPIARPLLHYPMSPPSRQISMRVTRRPAGCAPAARSRPF